MNVVSPLKYLDPEECLARELQRRFSRRDPDSTRGILRLETPLAGCSPLQWLAWQQQPVRIYWSDRQSPFAAAGVGCADRIAGDGGGDPGDAVSQAARNFGPQAGRARYYGGMRFNGGSGIDEHWLPYGRSLFILPRFEVLKDSEGVFFACNIVLRPDQPPERTLEAVLAGLRNLHFHRPVAREPASALTGLRQDLPAREEWLRHVHTALQVLAAGEIDKIVLGRNTLLAFDTPLQPLSLLGKLKRIEPVAYHFYIQPQEGSAFLGATPERLYRRQGRIIETEAVAGTRRRGATAAEDRRLTEELLASDKEHREHAFVRRHIIDALSPLCHSLDVSGAMGLLRQSRVQHLYAYLHGRLRDGVSDRQLLTLLHPTPAVGGLPKPGALRHIERLEPFDRGWYAGPVGWIGADAAEFAVGIRSGLVNGRFIRLFAGAGVVRGSDPLLEWEEMENKISPFLNALEIA